MTRISEYYQISGQTPFLDIDVEKDNPLFLDPHSIRLQGAMQPFGSHAIAAMDSFFGEVASCVMSTKAVDQSRGLDLLQHFNEPWDTRLGFAKRGFRGHGGASLVGLWIWDALKTNLEALLRVGILRQIEDIPLFVEGVDRDITSDLTTRVVYDALCEFTGQMIAKFPEFQAGSHHLRVVQRQVWDLHRLRWSTKKVELPVVNDKALLLVPRDWARHALLMSARRFYDTSVLSYAQLEQAKLTRDGKLLKSPKDVLRTQASLARGRDTNLAVTRRAHDRDEDLLARFKQFVDLRYAPLSDADITRKTAS